jgi:hypothetical protein
MQDSSEESIYKWEERSDRLIPKREERDEEREWELEFEEIEGIELEQDDVMPRGSTSVHSRGPFRPKRRKSPYEQVMLNSTSVGRCC